MSKVVGKGGVSVKPWPWASKPGIFKSGNRKAPQIAHAELHEARSDPRVEAFLASMRKRGEALHRKGLIHK
jgi:hypothetical protein